MVLLLTRTLNSLLYVYLENFSEMSNYEFFYQEVFADQNLIVGLVDTCKSVPLTRPTREDKEIFRLLEEYTLVSPTWKMTFLKNFS